MKSALLVILLLGICSKALAGDGDEGEERDIPRPGLSLRRGYKGPRVISGLEFIPESYGGYKDQYKKELFTGGVTYIRWGKTSCPTTNGTELMYKGRAAGSHYTHKGGGTDLLCLPENPEFLASKSGGHRAYVYQTEYATSTGPSFQSLQNHDVPCATCFSSQRGVKIMIPGKTTCLKGWTREYYGYLMSAFHNHNRMTYSCVDVTAEAVPGTAKCRYGALLYHVEVQTGALPSAYINGNELTCVVCTK